MVSVTIQSRPSLSLFVAPSSLIAVFALLASLILAACAGPQLPPQASRQAEDSSGQPAPSIQQAGEAGEAPAPPSGRSSRVTSGPNRRVIVFSSRSVEG